MPAFLSSRFHPVGGLPSGEVGVGPLQGYLCSLPHQGEADLKRGVAGVGIDVDATLMVADDALDDIQA